MHTLEANERREIALYCNLAAVFACWVVLEQGGITMGIFEIHTTFVVDQTDLWLWLVVIKSLLTVRREGKDSGDNEKAGPRSKDNRL